jgi:hypothetical protein
MARKKGTELQFQAINSEVFTEGESGTCNALCSTKSHGISIYMTQTPGRSLSMSPICR